MFIMKGRKKDGTMHVWQVDGYVVNPPKVDDEDKIVVTVICILANGDTPLRQVAHDHKIYFNEIFVMNELGKTVDRISAPTRM